MVDVGVRRLLGIYVDQVRRIDHREAGKGVPISPNV
jgi:hypothetical protein